MVSQVNGDYCLCSCTLGFATHFYDACRLCSLRPIMLMLLGYPEPGPVVKIGNAVYDSKNADSYSDDGVI